MSLNEHVVLTIETATGRITMTCTPADAYRVISEWSAMPAFIDARFTVQASVPIRQPSRPRVEIVEPLGFKWLWEKRA